MTKTFRSAAITLGVMAAIITSFNSGASAHSNTPARARAQDYVATYATVATPPALSDGNFDMSGTRGRMGLGANPAHPEGPGNVSN